MEILTHKGFKKFDGVVSNGISEELLLFSFFNNNKLKCTTDHLFLMSDGETYTQAKDVNIGDMLYNNISIIDKIELDENEEVFDAINVEETNSYLTNNIVSHNCLICDELAFVQPNQAEDFWSSNFPTISKSQESKVILISTPKGQHNLFHRLGLGATNGSYNHNNRIPGKNDFVPIKYDGRCLPERTEKWAKSQRESLGDTLFRQEHLVEFLGSINTIIDADVLKRLFEEEQKDPILYDLQDKFRVYQKPVNGAQYTLGVDTAKGTGENYSTIQVLRMDSINPVDIEQVAVFECNRTDPYHFANIINRIAIYYNNAYIMVENNAEGGTVASELHGNYENEGLVNSGSKTADLGIRATKKSKNRAVILMKKMIENNMLKLNDYKTIVQLTDFTESANGSFSCINLNDDLLAGLGGGVYVVKQDVFEEDMSFKSPEDDEDEGGGLLSDIDDYEEPNGNGL